MPPCNIQVESPSKAKEFTIRGTLANIVDSFEQYWSEPAGVAAPEGTKVSSFLLNAVCCVDALPPKSEATLPALNPRLIPALGVVCSRDPQLNYKYPDIGKGAVKAMLASITLMDLCVMARENFVDISRCETKDDVIDMILDSEVALAPPTVNPRLGPDGIATGMRGYTPTTQSTSATVIEPTVTLGIATQTSASLPSTIISPPTIVFPPLIACEESLQTIAVPVSDDLSAADLSEAPGSVDTDRSALMAVYNATGGSRWRNRSGWGSSAPLEDWHGVRVNYRGRVVEVDLHRNNLTGHLPASVDKLTALKKLLMWGNELQGTEAMKMIGDTELVVASIFMLLPTSGNPMLLQALQHFRALFRRHPQVKFHRN